MVLQYNNVSLEYRWLIIHLKKKENTIHVDINDFVITNLRGQYLQKGILEQILYKGPYIYEVHEVCPIFNFHSSIFKRPPPLPTPPLFPPLKIIINQLRGYIILGWLLLYFWSFSFSVSTHESCLAFLWLLFI